MSLRLPLITFLLSLIFNIAAKAQQDTSVYALGRVNLPKKFTQSVTIKAAELEKIPFTNINDVITTWLYGYYGDKKSYIYVVDGSFNTDVNALSIFDIDEITMVQNAAAYLNGALPGQVLLLVKTKTHTQRKSGVNFNGQTNLINLRNNYNDGGSTKNFYHNYYVSTYKNTESLKFGVSATVQHNAFPAGKYNTLADKVYNSDRFKFNGYFNAKLNKSNTLNVTAGYMPQSDEVAIQQLSVAPQGTVINTSNGNSKQNLLYANVGVVSKISTGLTNILSFGYQSRKTSIDLNQKQTTNYLYIGGGYSSSSTVKTDSSGRTSSLLISDDLSYNLQLGKLKLNPNVNFTYKNISDNTSYRADAATDNPPSVYAISRDLNLKNKVALLTPSIAFNYDDILVVQGGFQKPLNTDMYATYKVKQTSLMPFANVGVDVLKAAGAVGKDISLFFSGSYAKSLAVTAEPYIVQSDQIMVIPNTTRYPYSKSVDFQKTFDQFQAGLTFSMLKNRLSLSYNYQLIKNGDFFNVPLIFSPSFVYYENAQVDRQTHINRFGVNAEVINNSNFKWQSAFNISVFRNNFSTSNPALANFVVSLSKKNVVTGGMINRFVYKKLSAGLDLLYCFNQERYIGSVYSSPDNKYYSINLQNIYVGYNFKALGQKTVEVYANSRNMLMTNNSTITDNRRFYGLGFKTEL